MQLGFKVSHPGFRSADTVLNTGILINNIQNEPKK